MKLIEVNDRPIVLMVSLICLVAIFTMGLWAIDLGASAEILSAQLGIEVGTESLVGFRSANAQYHIGMILSILSFMVLSVLFTYQILSKNQTGEN